MNTLPDCSRPAFRPADYLWKDAHETRDEAVGPPLPTSSPQRTGELQKPGNYIYIYIFGFIGESTRRPSLTTDKPSKYVPDPADRTATAQQHKLHHEIFPEISTVDQVGMGDLSDV